MFAVKGLEKLSEVRSGIMGAWRCLRMVLNAEKWEVSVPESFYGVVIEVKVGHLKLLGTWHALTRCPDCKSVVLTGYQHCP